MEKPKKIGCGLLFASGLVCILFSTIRIVQVGQDGRPRSPDPKWLTMWTIIECSTGKSNAPQHPVLGSHNASYHYRLLSRSRIRGSKEPLPTNKQRLLRHTGLRSTIA